MSVTTNHHHREILEGFDLTKTERESFDYIDWDAVEAGEDWATFFRYRGELYDLGEFTVTDQPGWHGARADSFFSGVVVRTIVWCPDHDDNCVIVGTWYAD